MLRKLILILVLFAITNSPAMAVDDDAKTKAAEFYNASVAESSKGNNNEAINLLKKAIEFNPDLAVAHFNLGAIYMRLDRYAESVSEFRKTVAIDPSDDQAKCHLSQSLMFINQVAESQAVLATIPAGSEWRQKAIDYIEELRKFRTLAKPVSEEMRKKGAALEQEAYEQNLKRNFDQALKLYRESLACDPARHSAYLNIGIIYYNRKNFPETIKPFKDCLSLKPDDYLARKYLGKSLLNVNCRDEGIQMLESIPSTDENYSDAQKYIADWKVYESKLSKSKPSNKTSSVSQGFQNQKEKAQALEEQAYNLNVAKKYEQALALYKQSIACDSDRYSAWFNIGLIYFNHEKYHEAIQPLRETLKFTPDDNLTRKILGMSLLNDDKREEGMNLLSAIPSGDPNYAEAQKYIADWKQYESQLAAQTAAAQQTAKTEEAAKTNQNQNTVESVVTGSSEDTPVKDKWALVVGISKFANSQYNLKYAAKDAKDFYNYLISEGNFKKDHVLLLLNENATRRNIMAAFGDKFLPAVCRKGDLFAIYISTHGTPANKDPGKRNFIIAYDTEAEALYETGVDMDELYRRVREGVDTDRGLIVMDTCYSGAGVPGARGVDDGGNFDASLLAQGAGHLVMTSSSPSQRSWESKVTENGVFTKYLIQNLKLTKGHVKNSYDKLKDDVGWEVQNAFNQQQHPQMGGEWKGKDLILNAVPTSPRQILNPDLIKLMNLSIAPKAAPKMAPKK